MKTKIGTSFGLALMLLVGVIATMLALGMFSPNKASAFVGVVSVQSVSNTPDKPGLTSSFTLSFTTQKNLTAGETLTVVFDSAYGVPTTISKNTIILTTVQSTGGSSNPIIDPAISTCSAADVPNDACTASGDTVVILTIGDTRPSDSSVEALTWAAGHKLTFSPLAGITNPTSAPSASTDHWINIITSNETTAEGKTASNVTATPRFLSLSSTSGTKGSSVTISGSGYTSGGTASVFLDGCPTGNTTNQLRDGTEPIIATSDAAISGGAFTASFSIDERFGVGSCVINAHDHLGNLTTRTASAANDVSYSVKGKVTTSKSSVTRGESVDVVLAQWGSTAAVRQVSFGGVPLPIAALDDLTPSSSGSLTMSVTVPTTAPLGTQRVEVVSSAETRNVNIEIVGAPVTISPSTAVPDQKVTITATGFTTGGSATVAAGNATCASSGIVITGTVCWASSHTETTIDNSGNLVLTFTVPDNSTLHTAGGYELVVTDSSNRTGSGTLTIPSRALTLDPSESRRGSSVGFSGSGFPSSATISVTYKVSTASTLTVATATADSTGNFSGTFSVPTTALIPSTNDVKASGTGQGGGDTASAVTKTVSHKIPGASVTVSVSSGASGTTTTVTGNGFPGFTAMSALTIGGVSALPVPNPASDVDGLISATVLIPQLSTGTKALLVTIGSGTSAVTASTDFTVEEAAAAVAVPETTETVFADEVTSDNLVRVWSFSNADQAWSFFDPAFTDVGANTYTEATGGDIVWVNVTAETTFQGSTLYAGWNLISLS